MTSIAPMVISAIALGLNTLVWLIWATLKAGERDGEAMAGGYCMALASSIPFSILLVCIGRTIA